MGATEDGIILFHAVPDDRTTTVGAARRQCLNGAFERIETVDLPVHHDLEDFVVGIATCFALAHIIFICISRSVTSRLRVRRPSRPESHRPSPPR